jgi:hypothetical protein
MGQKPTMVKAPSTSALGHLQTSPAQDGMSASPLKADIRASGQHIRYGLPDIRIPTLRADLPLFKVHESRDNLGFDWALSFTRFGGRLENISGG